MEDLEEQGEGGSRWQGLVTRLPDRYLLEGQGGLVPVLACEVVVHAKIRLATQLVPGGAVRDALDHTALEEGQVQRPPLGRGEGAASQVHAQETYPWGGGHHPVGENKEV